MEDNDDFPFSFGNVSDDEESDGIFCQPKVEAQPTASTPVKAAQEPYYPQIDQDGWFHNSAKSVQETMLQEKTGATKIKMRADHYYMLGQFKEAYDLAHEYCRIIALNEINLIDRGNGGIARPDEGHTTSPSNGGDVLKVTDSKEMQEMIIRCAIKLGRMSEAADLADGLVALEPGTVFLKAKVYSAVGRFDDAAHILVDYQKTRSSNYAVWRSLGETILTSIQDTVTTPPSPFTPDSDSVTFVKATTALLALLRARHLMRCSLWSSVSYAQQRYDREMSILCKNIASLEHRCDIVRPYIATADIDDLSMQAQFESKIITPLRKILESWNDSIASSLTTSTTTETTATTQKILLPEVVDFVVSAWDPQVISSSTTPNQC
ncbi:hypothetical protein MVEG_11860 [Podila verticillata NRRL 6337]|uniref:Uncharacterized protein n=1 Tax=Podila verticillata NRRL 6337 TaxID=1069443 RepID=A0A086TJU5_9FUNG|nr:hypothetical protein MVEG_11860 [Podila verticillata NRRL 6337]